MTIKEIANSLYNRKLYTWERIFNTLVCFWAATLCFPMFNPIFYVVFITLIWGTLNNKVSFSFNLREKSPAYALLLYLLWLIISILWSDDVRGYFRSFEKLIPLLMLVVILFIDGILKYIRVKSIFISFLIGIVCALYYLIIKLGIDLVWGDFIGKVKIIGLLSINPFDGIQHRTYFGITLLMSIPLFLQQVKLYRWKQKISFIVIIFLICIFSIMSGARLLMLLSLALTVLFSFRLFSDKVECWKKITFLTVVLLLGSLTVIQNQRIKDTIYKLDGGLVSESSEPRHQLWSAAFDLVKVAPWTGYGLGNVETNLINSYSNHQLKIAHKRKQNAHNQYIQTILHGGIIALFLLLVFALTVIIKNRSSQKNKYSMLIVNFFIIYGLAFMGESILERNIGVFPLVFWLFLFLVFDVKDLSETSVVINRHMHRFSFSALIIFLSIFLIAYFIPSSSDFPRTSTMGDFKTIAFDKLPQKKQLPISVKKGLFVTHEMIYNDSYTALDFFNHNFFKTDSLSVNFSIWCYVSNEGVEKAAAYQSDDNHYYESRYDLSKIGTWQRLQIDKQQNFGIARSFIQILFDESLEYPIGEVYFVKPSVVINGDQRIK